MKASSSSVAMLAMMLAVFCAGMPAVHESFWFPGSTHLGQGRLDPTLDLNPILAPICLNMTPIHGDYVAQTSASPYKVTVDKSKVAAGGILNVTVSGATFKGFFMEARYNETTLLGTFLPRSDNYSFVASCAPGKNNALFYENRGGLTELTIQWKAPETPVTVALWCSIVKNFEEFWVGDKSPEVQVVESE